MNGVGKDEIQDKAVSLSKLDDTLQGSIGQINTNKNNIGDKTKLSTNNKNDLVSAINEVFQSGNEVKQRLLDALIANNIVPSNKTVNDYTFQQLIDLVRNNIGTTSGLMDIPYLNIGDTIDQVIAVNENSFFYLKATSYRGLPNTPHTRQTGSFSIRKFDFNTRTISDIGYTFTDRDYSNSLYYTKRIYDSDNYIIVNGAIFDRSMNLIYDIYANWPGSEQIYVDATTFRIFKFVYGTGINSGGTYYYRLQLWEFIIASKTWVQKWEDTSFSSRNFAIHLISSNYVIIAANSTVYRVNVDNNATRSEVTFAYNSGTISLAYGAQDWISALRYGGKCAIHHESNTSTGTYTDFYIVDPTISPINIIDSYGGKNQALVLEHNLGPSYYKQNVVGDGQRLMFINSDGTFGRIFQAYNAHTTEEQWIGFTKNFIISDNGNLYRYK